MTSSNISDYSHRTQRNCSDGTRRVLNKSYSTVYLQSKFLKNKKTLLHQNPANAHPAAPTQRPPLSCYAVSTARQRVRSLAHSFCPVSPKTSPCIDSQPQHQQNNSSRQRVAHRHHDTDTILSEHQQRGLLEYAFILPPFLSYTTFGL